MYPHRHTGTVLICGFARTFHDDLARAQELRPGAPIIAVNEAALHVKAFAIFSLHRKPHKLGRWAREQAERFGTDFTVHSSGDPDDHELRAANPYVDYWWPEARGKGTSTWSAAKMALLMGFEERILVGMPLERMPYGDGTMARDFRIEKILKIYRDYVRHDIEFHRGIRAMSGWTRHEFGEPEPLHGNRG